MLAYIFRLEALLNQRLEEKRHSEEVLLARDQDLAAERRTLLELANELEQTVKRYQMNRLELLISDSRVGLVFSKRNDFLFGLKLDVQDAQSAVLAQQVFLDQAVELVQEARQALAKCQRDADILVRYKEKAETRFLQDVAHHDELEQDEIGNVMYLSRRTSR